MAPDFTTVRRFVGWFSIAVLGVASWLPAEEIIRTGADGRLEHAAAYLIGDFHRIPSTCYGGILEFGQLFVSGRQAAILDWAASSGGVLYGFLLYDPYQRVYASKSPQEYAEAAFDRRS